VFAASLMPLASDFAASSASAFESRSIAAENLFLAAERTF
jgi:hypothetical protein